MPIRKVKVGWKWGGKGKVYPSREGAERQAAAAHANGFVGDARPVKLRAPSRDGILLPAIRANAGVEASYRRKITALIDAMGSDVVKTLSDCWDENSPEIHMASDANPLQRLRAALKALGKRWIAKFNDVSATLATEFVDKSVAHTDNAMMRTLKDAGFTVEFTLGNVEKQAYQSIISENIVLIRSIPEQYHAKVEGDVWRTVASGYDLNALTDKLQDDYRLTRRRAAFISRDQAHKAKAVIEGARRRSLGITHARWQHSGAGKEPRPEHVSAGRDDGGKGRLFDVTKGLFLEGRWVLPGEAINCRCTSRAVIPGFED